MMITSSSDKTLTSFRHEPNDETIEALEEVNSGKSLESFNRSELEKLIASL